MWECVSIKDIGKRGIKSYIWVLLWEEWKSKFKRSHLASKKLYRNLQFSKQVPLVTYKFFVIGHHIYCTNLDPLKTYNCNETVFKMFCSYQDKQKGQCPKGEGPKETHSTHIIFNRVKGLKAPLPVIYRSKKEGSPNLFVY